MSIREKIIQLFESNTDLTIKEIVDQLMVSKQAVHYAINQLLDKQQIVRLGRTPKTIYRLAQKNTESNTKKDFLNTISPEEQNLLDESMLVVTEIGELLTGFEAFEYWCSTRKEPVLKTLKEYSSTQKKYQLYKNENGIINGLSKLMNTEGYEKIHLDELYYLDFYAIERFGKTKLGNLLHYAKQGQNKMLMRRIVDEIQSKIELLISQLNIDAIAYVPPTIRREVQLMKFMETHLRINLPKVKIQKISGLIPIPQKSLNKLHERIKNAENTFSINETNRYNRILLFDDAVGSGSTLNQIAGKLKDKNVGKEIIGLAIVGSFKGFDVITDV